PFNSIFLVTTVHNQPHDISATANGSMTDLFDSALKQGIAKELSMGKVNFQEFIDGIWAYGTRDLRGCSVVLVASQKGAIMAHIDPRGDEHVHQMMDEFVTLYVAKKAAYFPPSSETLVVYGITIMPNGEKVDGLEHQTAIIFQRLFLAHRDLGLPFFEQEQYKFRLQLRDDSPSFPGKGSVFVQATGSQLFIFVENKAFKVVTFS
ncbi:MAG: hypothetical protein Q9224_005820, partial [Gallowayella concinna]